MKILFCSPHPLDRRLGASKVIMELADELAKIGWECVLASDEEICPGIGKIKVDERFFVFKDALARFLRQHAGRFDVVDYDHACLPFPRADFSPETLFVARSVLLTHHFQKIPLPRFKGVRSFAGELIKGPWRRSILARLVGQCDSTLRETDLINVSNNADKAELVSRGFDGGKIIVLPYGLTESRFAQFQPATPAEPPVVAFVGTFDTRKGGRELPDIVALLREEVPGVKVRLLGARYRGENEVLSYFPKKLHSSLEIISRFDPNDLPGLLAPCSAGIFPSYIEGFGFAVLEMLAAGLPVIAYDAPGPDMILPGKLLAKRGDFVELARITARLLKDKNELESARTWARGRAAQFRWSDFAAQTSRIYMERLKVRRRGHSGVHAGDST